MSFFVLVKFGFRAKFSTEYAVMDIYEKLLSNLDKKLNTCAIFLDLAKAFDSVSHKILIQKLQKYGIHGKLLDDKKLFYFPFQNCCEVELLQLHQ